MKYRELADTGVFVSELCLGTMTFGGRGQMWELIGGLEQKSVDDLVGSALDAGIHFLPMGIAARAPCWVRLSAAC